jgi:octaprenyl-diphosphate synthase
LQVLVDAGRKTKQDSENGFESLSRLVAADMREVNALILEKMESQVPLIPTLAGHIISSGGKRLRPILTLSSAKLCGYEGRRHLALAACVEFIHTATLLHDDVVDESKLRRGASTANALWGNEASVLVGDFLFSRAFQLMVADGSLKVLKILSDASATIAEGEVQQLMTANDTGTTKEAYLQVIGAKTAALFAAACQIGAVVAERPEEEESALRDFGQNLGMAFQLVDDVLDYSAQEAQLGKAVGDDFRDGKITLPVLLAFRAGSESEKAFWRRCLEDSEQNEEDLAKAVELILRHGTLDESMDLARSYAQAAHRNLDAFAPAAVTDALHGTVEFCVGRNY